MLTIPAAIQTLLTSRLMVGENRPTGVLTIADQPAGTDLTDPANWTDWITFLDKPYGNMAETSDGRAVIWYVDGESIKIAFSPTVVGIVNQTESFTAVGAGTIATFAGATYIRGSMTLLDGKLQMAIVYLPSGGTYRVAEHWADADGTGATWAKVSDITTDLGSGAASSFDVVGNTLFPSLIHKLSGGAYVCHLPYNYALTSKGTVRAFYSSDSGAAWTAGTYLEVWAGARIPASHSMTFLPLSASSWATFHLASSGSIYGCLWTNYGADLALATAPNLPYNVSWIDLGSEKYMACRYNSHDIGVWRYIGSTVDIDLLCDIANWDLIHTITADVDDIYVWLYRATEVLVMQHAVTLNDSSQVISGAATDIKNTVSIPIKAITIDRSKGTASQATVVLDNKLGIYAPDSAGEWNQVIWPNKGIEITLGYGAEQQTVFTGLIDEVYMSSYPAELTITARDYSKLALDQVAETTIDGVVTYSFAYANQTPEYIFTAMATQAGWAAGDIHADVTGITLAEFLAGHESIADCFQRLCEITGWEWFCDEQGDIYFRAATDPAAVSVYSFTEGVDIFSLDYRISDAELYRNIVVWTSDTNGSTIKASGVWGAADYNNILAKKTLIINAGDLVTDAAGCAAIVAAQAAAITPKVREVNFVAVGNPYVQIGDVIQVTETTTTISEYYRVLEISHQIGANGSPVFSTSLRCYHFAMPT